ncbi:MAG: hypothetical protein ACPLZY_04225, partial [Candidatus Norongarragalinales archaeon]
MKSAFKSLYGFAAITMLLLAAMPAILAGLPPSVPPSDNVAMWIQPTTINLTTATVGLGYKFNVTVMGKSNVECKGWQFWLRWKGDLLNTTSSRVWYYKTNPAQATSDFMAGAGGVQALTPSVKYLYDGVYSRVEFGEPWTSGSYASAKPNGAGMAIIEFEVIAVPEKGIIPLETWLEISHEGYTGGKTWIWDATNNVKIGTSYDALYGLVWAPPPGPSLEVSPTTRFYDRYAIRNGTTFTETVKLAGLSAAWYLTNVSFTLTFNPAELELMDIVKNEADWNAALTVNNSTAGQVVTYAETNKTLSGDVDIITLTFVIIDQELYPTVENHDLGLTGVSAFDHMLEIPVTPVQATIT